MPCGHSDAWLAALTLSLNICPSPLTLQGLGEKINASLVHATATGRQHLHPSTGTLGDGNELSTKVGRFIATDGPLVYVAFADLGSGALSTSHPGLAVIHSRCHDFPDCSDCD